MEETPEQKAAREAEEAARATALSAQISAEVKKATGGLAKTIKDAVSAAVAEAVKPKEEDPQLNLPIKDGDKTAAELAGERKKRESLEKRVNELIEEGKKAREDAEQADRFSTIKTALREAGVVKVDLAFKAIRDDIKRNEAKDLIHERDGSEVSLKDYLTGWTKENPEFMPARTSGGSGNQPNRGGPATNSATDLDSIKPGKITEAMREEIASVARQTMLGKNVT